MWQTLHDAPWIKALPNSSSLETVALALNANMWTTLGELTGKPSIVFKSEQVRRMRLAALCARCRFLIALTGSRVPPLIPPQTPLIYDPMSVILFGYGSCTGISITYADALRTLGIPARLVGTPAWHGRQADGNHNWVEVWLGPQRGWCFIEGAPAGGGETFANPCDKVRMRAVWAWKPSM